MLPLTYLSWVSNKELFWIGEYTYSWGFYYFISMIPKIFAILELIATMNGILNYFKIFLYSWWEELSELVLNFYLFLRRHYFKKLFVIDISGIQCPNINLITSVSFKWFEFIHMLKLHNNHHKMTYCFIFW